MLVLLEVVWCVVFWFVVMLLVGVLVVGVYVVSKRRFVFESRSVCMVVFFLKIRKLCFFYS